MKNNYSETCEIFNDNICDVIGFVIGYKLLRLNVTEDRTVKECIFYETP